MSSPYVWRDRSQNLSSPREHSRAANRGQGKKQTEAKNTDRNSHEHQRRSVGDASPIAAGSHATKYKPSKRPTKSQRPTGANKPF
jgi:hypothetical protein